MIRRWQSDVLSLSSARAIARAVRTKRFKVAVLLDAARAYDRDVLKGITHFNKLYDKFTFFFYSPRYIHPENQDKLLKRLSDWHPEGIIAREMPGLRSVQAWQVPLIVSPHTAVYEGAVNLWADNEAIGALAAEYFSNKGYRHFGILGFRQFQWSAEREVGFSRATKVAGIQPSVFLFDDRTMLWEDLPESLSAWLRAIPKPCAIFSVTDELNIHLLEAAKNAGYAVPDELAILGVDNDSLLCEMTQPTLSSIDQNAVQAGFEIAQGLLTWMETAERPAANFIHKPKAIIDRQSTSALAIDDEEVRKALTFINTHAPAADIDVNDVVEATTHSRRILEKKFSQRLNSSILDEIKKVRIRRIQYLLAESDFNVQQIAYEMGFDNPANITRYFKLATGYNPLEYRKAFGARKG
ncbi:XylR family transcriptional regulator [Parachryseolinea silvisoli]|uniref:XylR family transcriptional regulator n=1 Tax=Parachryseolinea silvisoli TaxID=2873601 RepID=UPI002265F371|nr:XylR family transcriptional regulator [Parachryseolinea silvisoli]MCD9017052.1 XylR family transcriptional regulator [Parachryseolinea silvisoli]